MKINARAQTELERLYKRDGCLTAEAVVESARVKASPLHRFFNWNDTEAAHRYRLVQAQWLVRHVKVNVVVSPHRTVTTRVYVNYQDEDDQSIYVRTSEAMNNADMRKHVLQEALDDLRELEVKYAVLKELAPLFKVAHKLQRQYDMAGKARLGAQRVGAGG